MEKFAVPCVAAIIEKIVNNAFSEKHDILLKKE